MNDDREHERPHWIARLTWRWPAPETIDTVVLCGVVAAGVAGIVILWITR